MREYTSSSKGSGDVAGSARGGSAFRLGPLPGVPGEVQASFLLWLAAVAAGIVETVIRIVGSLAGGPASSGLLVRVIVYAVAVYVITQMRLGRRWARVTLAVLLGVVGTLSLVIDPISWLAAGTSLGDVFAEADLLFFFVAPIRVIHLVAVLGALALMFSPAANDYFRASRTPHGTR